MPEGPLGRSSVWLYSPPSPPAASSNGVAELGTYKGAEKKQG